MILVVVNVAHVHGGVSQMSVIAEELLAATTNVHATLMKLTLTARLHRQRALAGNVARAAVFVIQSGITF